MTRQAGARIRAAFAACIAFTLWAAGAVCLAQDPSSAACVSCHDVGQKMEKRAHAPLPCRWGPFTTRCYNLLNWDFS